MSFGYRVGGFVVPGVGLAARDGLMMMGELGGVAHLLCVITVFFVLDTMID